MCDVRWLDPRIDPNGRRPGWCYLGDPRTANTSPPGLARYSSLRSWLSQWSYDLSNAKGPKNAARIRRTPVLQVENQADDAVPASHNPTIRAALATPDKEYVRIEGATHYYQNQPTQLPNASLRYWIGAAAKDCLQTDHSSGFSGVTPTRPVITRFAWTGSRWFPRRAERAHGGCLFIRAEWRRQTWQAKAFAALR